MKQLSKNLSHDHPWSKYYPIKHPYQLKDAEMPIYHWLDQVVFQCPEKVSLNFYNNELNFKKFQKLSLQFACGIKNIGLQKGDRVILMLPNCIHFAIAFFGLLRAGVIAVPINPQFTSTELVYYLNDLEPKLIFILDSFETKVKKTIDLSSSKVKIVTIKNMVEFDYSKDEKDTSNAYKNQINLGFENFLIDKKKFRKVKINPKEDIAAILYTGGTTGEPKGVMLSHHNICYYVIAQTNHFSVLLGNKKALLALPPHHIFGLCMIISAVFRKATLLLIEIFNPESIYKIIQEEKVEAFFGVPAMYSALVNYYMREQQKDKLNHLTFCLIGASPVSTRLWNKIKEIAPNATIIEGYGLTEASGGPLLDPVSENYQKKVGSVGIPIFNTEVKVGDPISQKDMPPGEHGEIITRGNNIFKGYWRKPILTREALKDGWLHTKDIGKMDEDGIFFIEGRLDDMINIRGEKVWPREIEKVLEDHKKVKEVAVIGVKDNNNDDQVIQACIVLEDNQEVSKSELKDFCKKKLVLFKIPGKIVFYNELPKSHLGKILHYKLRKLSKNL